MCEPGTARGQFDVIVDDEVIASRSRGLLVRLLGMGWPDTDAIVAAIRSRQGGTPSNGMP